MSINQQNSQQNIQVNRANSGFPLRKIFWQSKMFTPCYLNEDWILVHVTSGKEEKNK